MVYFAAGILTASTAFLAYRYFYSKPPIPKLQVNGTTETTEEEGTSRVNDAITRQGALSPPQTPIITHEEDDPQTSPDTTPKQKPQNDRTLMLPPPPPLLNGAPRSASSLMPPPQRPVANIPKPSTSLRPPPSAASSLRAPPTPSPAPLRSSTLAPSTSTMAPTSRPSKKVLLSPGHSPLDWAALQKRPPSSTFLRGADVPVDRMIRVTPSMLKAHTGRKGKDAWGVFGGKVYNMTRYLDFHPGGVDQIMKAAGRMDGTKLFLEAHPWVSWENMLGECCVGILVGEGEGEDEETNGDKEKMEEMD